MLCAYYYRVQIGCKVPAGEKALHSARAVPERVRRPYAPRDSRKVKGQRRAPRADCERARAVLELEYEEGGQGARQGHHVGLLILRRANETRGGFVPTIDEFVAVMEPIVPPSLKRGDECPLCWHRTVFTLADVEPLWIDDDYFGEPNMFECTNCGWTCETHVYCRLPRRRR